MYFYNMFINYEAGRKCVPWGTPIEPITHYVRKKKVEIFMFSLYNEDEIREYNLGELETVRETKMSVADYNDQTYLLYSKYGGDHSNIMGIPIEVETHIEQMDVYDFSSWDGGFPPANLTTGTEETNSDTRTFLAKLDLNPYSSSHLEPLNPSTFEPDFRFTYTGREYNIETGNYYYRFRTYDSGIGRFTSKDRLKPFGYGYVNNNPENFVDIFGLDPILKQCQDDFNINLQNCVEYAASRTADLKKQYNSGKIDEDTYNDSLSDINSELKKCKHSAERAFDECNSKHSMDWKMGGKHMEGGQIFIPDPSEPWNLVISGRHIRLRIYIDRFGNIVFPKLDEKFKCTF